MKLRVILTATLAAGLLSLASASNAQAFELLDRVLNVGGHGGCGCEPACGCDAEPSCCAPEPTCCAPEPSCCAPKCCKPKRCHRGLLHGLFNRCCKPKCCEPACGCDAGPSCGCDAGPSCGCDAGHGCCKPKRCRRPLFHRCKSNCCEPACGCEPSCHG